MKFYLYKIFSIIFLLAVFNFTGCAQENNSKEISVQELKEMQNENPDLVILDVRTPAELVGPLGKIEGVVNIPVQELEQRINEVEKYKDKDIAIICRTGNRSGAAQKVLEKHGIESVNVQGGMVEYRELE